MLATVGVLVVSGCATSQPDTADPWAAEIAQARELATTELQRQVMTDGRVSDAEFDELQQDLVRCVADRGYELTVREDGTYELGTPGGGGFADERPVSWRPRLRTSAGRSGSGRSKACITR